jgi:hypothetical protein
MTDRFARYLDAATAAFEAGFKSEAARKRALEDLSHAYEITRGAVMNAILKARTPETEEQNSDDYWAIPSGLHQVRDRHFDIAARYDAGFVITRDLIALRAVIKAAPLVVVERDATEARVETIRKSLLEEIERRGAQYVHALDMGRAFGGLRVTVNAHLVHGHKGTVFVRHYFYLLGVLTPLQVIMAAADTLEREAAKA